jgi:hypothetical protein
MKKIAQLKENKKRAYTLITAMCREQYLSCMAL